MLKIGITGGIGSGKTYISDIFKRLGVPVYNADHHAKILLNTDLHLIDQITKLFGLDAYVNKTLNSRHIASRVFTDKHLLSELNRLIHPMVEKDFLQWCVLQKDKMYALKEAAILFESGSYRSLNKTIVVAATKELRIKRVLKRENTSRQEILQRMNNQWSTDKLTSLADFIIKNNDNSLLLPQIIQIDKKIRREWLSLENG